MSETVFHLAYHVRDLDVARHYYGNVLGCVEGRSTDTWVDFDFFGHQLSLHLGEPFATTDTGYVDGVAVPMPHLGAVLPLSAWRALVERLEAAASDYVIAPSLRYRGQTGEQYICFVRDPFGNPIEFKALLRAEELMRKQ